MARYARYARIDITVVSEFGRHTSKTCGPEWWLAGADMGQTKATGIIVL